MMAERYFDRKLLPADTMLSDMMGSRLGRLGNWTVANDKAHLPGPRVA